VAWSRSARWVVRTAGGRRSVWWVSRCRRPRARCCSSGAPTPHVDLDRVVRRLPLPGAGGTRVSVDEGGCRDRLQREVVVALHDVGAVAIGSSVWGRNPLDPPAASVGLPVRHRGDRFGTRRSLTSRCTRPVWSSGFGVGEIARALGRDPATISRELRRNAASRSGMLTYRAGVAQWKAELAARRPKTAKLVAKQRLREPLADLHGAAALEVAQEGGKLFRGAALGADRRSARPAGRQGGVRG